MGTHMHTQTHVCSWCCWGAVGSNNHLSAGVTVNSTSRLEHYVTATECWHLICHNEPPNAVLSLSLSPSSYSFICSSLPTAVHFSSVSLPLFLNTISILALLLARLPLRLLFPVPRLPIYLPPFLIGVLPIPTLCQTYLLVFLLSYCLTFP